MSKIFNRIKSEKHKQFILAVIECGGNGTRAYKMVYPSVKNSTAATNSHKLLKNTYISAAVSEMFEQIWDDRKSQIGQTFKNILDIANADIRDIVKYEDGIMEVKNFSETDTRALQSISQNITETKEGENVNTKIQMYDKLKALSEMAKILKMIDNKIELSGDVIITPAKRPQQNPRKAWDDEDK